MPAKLTPQARARLIEAVTSGREMAAVAGDFGVTRQRVYQIMRALGVQAPSSHAARRERKKGVAVLARLGHDDEAIAQKLGLRYHAVAQARRAAGIGPSGRDSVARRAFLGDDLKQHMAAGGSFSGFAERHGISGATARRLGASLGLTTTWGRWRDRGHRLPLIAKWRGEGAPWEAVAALLSEREGRKIGVGGIHAWATRHAPHLVGSRGPQKRLAA